MPTNCYFTALAKLNLLKHVMLLIEFQHYIQAVQTVIATTNENTPIGEVTMAVNDSNILMDLS